MPARGQQQSRPPVHSEKMDFGCMWMLARADMLRDMAIGLGQMRNA